MNFLDPIKPYLNLIKIAALALLIAAAVWLWNSFVDRQQQIGYDRAAAEYQVKQLAAEQTARAKEQSMQQRLNEATHAAAERETKLRADYAAAHRTALGLRDTIANLRHSLSGTTADACRVTADTALNVFGECSAEVGRLAEASDRHASDVRTLSEAWPR